MDEPAPPQGSGLSVPVDLISDDPPACAEHSAPAAKKTRLLYQQPSSSGSSAAGRPTGTLWPFFTRSAFKQNKSHYSAFCDACTLAGVTVKVLGVSESMKGHLTKCSHQSEAVHAWAKDWTKDSEPFTSNAAESCAVTLSQSGLQRFMPHKCATRPACQQCVHHVKVFDSMLLHAHHAPGYQTRCAA